MAGAVAGGRAGGGRGWALHPRLLPRPPRLEGERQVRGVAIRYASLGRRPLQGGDGGAVGGAAVARAEHHGGQPAGWGYHNPLLSPVLHLLPAPVTNLTSCGRSRNLCSLLC